MINHVKLSFLGLITLLVLGMLPVQGDDISVIKLLCESRQNPVGIDISNPVLTWNLSSSQRGASQTAYQVLVASSLELLGKNQGDLWDSGKFSTNATLVEYQGQALHSSQQCFWKTKVWDNAGKESGWSDVVSWMTGIMDPQEWKQAQWIGKKEDESALTEETAGFSMIGFHSKPQAIAEGEHWVQITMDKPQALEKIVIHAMSHGEDGYGFPVRFRLEVSNQSDFKNSRIVADETKADFTNPGSKPLQFKLDGAPVRALRLTAKKLASLPSSKPGEGFGFALDEIQMYAGEENVARGQSVSASDSFQGWRWGNAGLVRGAHDPDYLAKIAEAKRNRIYSLRLRRDLVIKSNLKRAIFHVSGLGHYDLEVNGKETSINKLTPGWTDYKKTALYDSIDLISLLKPGTNALGLTLAGGMYRIPKSDRYAKFTGAYGPLQAIGMLDLEYADGSKERVVTDANWQQGSSPITFNTIYGGEDYDARLEQEGWSSPGFETSSSWKAADLLQGPGGELRGCSEAGAPIREIETLKPISSKSLTTNIEVYDLGQNASLIPRITVHGPAGASVKITAAELVGSNGYILDPMCGGKSFCTYTLSEKPSETWQPQFYYRGARYLKVETTPATTAGALPVVDSIQGVVVHSSATPIGYFACSNDLFNQIYTLVRWAQRSNMMSLMTDCPHREKLGWLEEDHLNGPSLRFNFDLNTLFGKICHDMADAQTKEGLVPDIAPEYYRFAGGLRDSPEWGSSVVLVPWQQYEFTGDAALLKNSYEAMRRYVDYLSSKAKADIVDYGLGDWYDIGPKASGQSQLTPKALTATAFYYQDVEIMAKTAAMLSKNEEAKKYVSLAEQIKNSFNKKFFDLVNGNYATGSQCANSVPLVMGLVPEDKRALVLNNIVKDVQSKGLTAGDVGYRYLLRALADGGRSDVIYTMNNQSEKPGYGFQLKHGASSLTEAWDAGFGSSQNHFMLGQINEWFFRDLAGIQFNPETPGFSQIIIKPALVGDLTWAGANYESVHGLISSWWKRTGDQVTLDVTIPAGSSATVFLQTQQKDFILESGTSLSLASGVKLIEDSKSSVSIKIQSGSYHFTFHS